MKQIIHYILAYIITAVILIICLLGAASIPNSAIDENIKKSAAFLTKDPQNFHYQLGTVPSSIRDQYADANLLNIAFYIDPSHPWDSIIWDRYCWDGVETANIGFREAVEGNLPANKEYLRYWHGSLMFIRPLLSVFDIQQIYILHYAVMAVLLLILTGILFRHHLTSELICLAVALAAVNLWFVPSCLEYYWMFLVMFVSSIVAVRMSLEKQYRELSYLFLITGIVAAFLDFLTVETITALIPLLLALRIQQRQKIKSNTLRFIIKNLTLWAVGFVGMWVMKWIIASVYLGESVVPYLREKTLFHLGVKSHMPIYVMILQGFCRNIYALAPISYGNWGAAVLVILIVAMVVIPVWKNQVQLKRNINRKYLFIYLMIAILPYIRYSMLPFHSWHHYFFTHRAQAVTILALGFCVLEIIEKRPEQGIKNS